MKALKKRILPLQFVSFILHDYWTVILFLELLAHFEQAEERFSHDASTFVFNKR